jgi:YfiH family protein
VITLGALNDLNGLRHGFFTRAGGVSEGIFASLNCGYGGGDAEANVSANRARAMARLGGTVERLVTLRQVHSPTVVTVREPWAPAAAPEADALVTAVPGLALGILTADCVPVLFADAKAGVIGAAHAGWKGAQAGVIANTVRAMVALGAKPSRMVAAIGPCIAQRSYEVGPEFPAPFLAADPMDQDFFAPSIRSGHFRFDLSGLVERRIGAAGVGLVQRCPHDTCTEEDRFFSYRRATLRGETGYGRGLSVILLQP